MNLSNYEVYAAEERTRVQKEVHAAGDYVVTVRMSANGLVGTCVDVPGVEFHGESTDAIAHKVMPALSALGLKGRLRVDRVMTAIEQFVEMRYGRC